MDEDMIRVTGVLKRPAGDSADFSSLELIRKNRKEFVLSCHDAWKKLHEEAIYQIITFDTFLQEEKKRPTLPSFREFAHYSQAIWRKVNDAIVWSVFGLQRHKIKRLCLYHERSFLSDSNDDHAVSTIKALNRNPMSLAIWNDATSSVDIGDVLYIKDGMKPTPFFLELKEGPVNNAIIELLSNGTKEEYEKFSAKYGDSGVKQLKRVIRQSETSKKALSLLNNEYGIDPVVGMKTRILGNGVPEERYDSTLNEILKDALNSPKFLVEKIESLFVLVDTRSDGHRINNKRIVKTLEDKLGRSLYKPKQSWDGDRIAILNQGIKLPLAFPVFLRGLDDNIIAEIINGKLANRVHFYFDWDSFADIVHMEGGTFEWSDEKEVRRTQGRDPRARPLLVRERIPQIVLNNCTLQFSDPNLVEVFFDGLTPKSLAKRFVVQAQSINQNPDTFKDLFDQDK